MVIFYRKYRKRYDKYLGSPTAHPTEGGNSSISNHIN